MCGLCFESKPLSHPWKTCWRACSFHVVNFQNAPYVQQVTADPLPPWHLRWAAFFSAVTHTSLSALPLYPSVGPAPTHSWSLCKAPFFRSAHLWPGWLCLLWAFLPAFFFSATDLFPGDGIIFFNAICFSLIWCLPWRTHMPLAYDFTSTFVHLYFSFEFVSYRKSCRANFKSPWIPKHPCCCGLPFLWDGARRLPPHGTSTSHRAALLTHSGSQSRSHCTKLFPLSSWRPSSSLFCFIFPLDIFLTLHYT